jgi:hypothetical protein
MIKKTTGTLTISQIEILTTGIPNHVIPQIIGSVCFTIVTLTILQTMVELEISEQKIKVLALKGNSY